MKLFICSMLATLALGARLENTYLPPISAKTAGGSGSFSSTPGFSGSLPSAFASSGSPFGGGLSSAYPESASGSFPSGQYNIAASRTYSSGPQFRILKLDSQNAGDGNYRFDYETENQIRQQESGEQRNFGNDQITSVHGTYSYTAPDGQHITVNYVADENGFRAEGDHIPTPPPVPAEIQQSIINAGITGGSGYYQGSLDSSEGYQGSEITAARSASRQYLAPAITRARQEGYRY